MNSLSHELFTRFCCALAQAYIVTWTWWRHKSTVQANNKETQYWPRFILPYGATRPRWVIADRCLHMLMERTNIIKIIKFQTTFQHITTNEMLFFNCNMHAQNFERGWHKYHIQYRLIFASCWTAIRWWRLLVQCGAMHWGRDKTANVLEMEFWN